MCFLKKFLFIAVILIFVENFNYSFGMLKNNLENFVVNLLNNLNPKDLILKNKTQYFSTTFKTKTDIKKSSHKNCQIFNIDNSDSDRDNKILCSEKACAFNLKSIGIGDIDIFKPSPNHLIYFDTKNDTAIVLIRNNKNNIKVYLIEFAHISSVQEKDNIKYCSKIGKLIKSCKLLIENDFWRAQVIPVKINNSNGCEKNMLLLRGSNELTYIISFDGDGENIFKINPKSDFWKKITDDGEDEELFGNSNIMDEVDTNFYSSSTEKYTLKEIMDAAN